MLGGAVAPTQREIHGSLCMMGGAVAPKQREMPVLRTGWGARVYIAPNRRVQHPYLAQDALQSNFYMLEGAMALLSTRCLIVVYCIS